MDDLLARAQIADVIARYCHVLDRRLWDRMGDCFTDAATYRFGGIDGDWRHFVGIARSVLDPLRISHHQTGNMLIVVDGETARSETYFTAYHRVAADAARTDPLPGTGAEYDVVIAGRYIDRFERSDGAWRIAHRTGVTDWRRDMPAADGGLFALPADWRGANDASDPGYAI